MHYYMLNPFFTPDGHSIDMSLGEEAVSNIVESAYWAIMAEVKIHDHRITKDHDDFFVFDNIDALKKAGDILEHYEIQFRTNIVEKTDKENMDYLSDQNYYKVLVFDQPEVDRTIYPRTYTRE